MGHASCSVLGNRWCPRDHSGAFRSSAVQERKGPYYNEEGSGFFSIAILDVRLQIRVVVHAMDLRNSVTGTGLFLTRSCKGRRSHSLRSYAQWSPTSRSGDVCRFQAKRRFAGIQFVELEFVRWDFTRKAIYVASLRSRHIRFGKDQTPVSIDCTMVASQAVAARRQATLHRLV